MVKFSKQEHEGKVEVYLMRYDKPVFFQRIKPSEYNAESGDYGADVITEVKRYASVTDTGTEQLKLIYGNIKQGSRTIRLQRPYLKPFDKIRIDEKIYSVSVERHLKIFIVAEVQ